MTDENARSYWGVLPGEVVRDTNLTIAAKYLYVILSSMAKRNGYCWPENEVLASEIQLSKRRVVELLGMLRDNGYIKIIFKQVGKKERRYIYCGMFPDRVTYLPEDEDDGCEISHEGDAEDSIPPRENSHTPMRKTRIPIDDEPIKEPVKEPTPQSPQGAAGKKSKANKYALQEDAKPLLREYVGTDRELRQALGDFILIRQDLHAINSQRAIAMLLKELDELSGGDREIKLQLIRQSCTNSWKSVFPLKGPRAAPPPNNTGWAPDPEVY